MSKPATYETKIELLAQVQTTRKPIYVTVTSKHDCFFVQISRKEAVKLILEAEDGCFYALAYQTMFFIHAN